MTTNRQADRLVPKGQVSRSRHQPRLTVAADALDAAPRFRRSGAASGAVLLALAATVGCATAPPPAAEPAPAPPAAETRFVDAGWVCGPATRKLAWSELGVPKGAMPVDLALGPDAVWVLFEPTFLLRAARAAGADDEPLFISPPQEGETWSAVDVDPADGSVWLARRDAYEALQVVDGGARRVRLERVTGDGGLVELVVGGETLHTTPFCADHALWSFDRQGGGLKASFEAPAGEGLEVDNTRFINMANACPRVHLARDAGGRLTAFDPFDVRLHRLGEDGWEEAGGPFDLQPPSRYTDVSTLRQERVGPEQAGRYLPDVVRGLTFLAGRPVLIGSPVMSDRGGNRVGMEGTVLYRLEDDVLVPAFERCDGDVLLDLESDATGHAAATERSLIVGAATGGQR
jgi:hypothetical protein